MRELPGGKLRLGSGNLGVEVSTYSYRVRGYKQGFLLCSFPLLSHSQSQGPIKGPRSLLALWGRPLVLFTWTRDSTTRVFLTVVAPFPSGG